MRSRNGIRLALCAVLALVCSCGGGDSTSPPVAVSSVTVSLSTASVAVGATIQATAVVRDVNGAVLADRTVTWSSSNPAVITINAASGMAAAVAAGTANLIATSEGITGQATATVMPPPVQIGTLTLTDAITGAALNLANIAGTVRVRSSLQVPVGASGTVVVRIDGREFARQTVSASIVTSAFMSPTSASAANVDLDMPIAVSTVTYNDVANAGVAGVADLLNGIHQLSVDYTASGATQPAASGQVSITTSTPDVFTGRVLRSGTLQPLNGNSWSNDALTIDIIPIRFGAATASGASASIADYLTDYRSGVPAGVVDLLTRSAGDITTPTTLTRSAFSYESKPATGSRIYLRSYAFGSTTVSPQTAEPNLNGNCIYTGGSGFIPNVTVTLPPLPQNCTRWITVNPIPQNLLGVNGVDIYSRIFHDTKAPTALAGAFTLPGRTTGTNQPAFGLSGSYGVVDNWVGRGLNLDASIDRTKLFDAGFGVDPGPVTDFYYGSSPTFTPSMQMRIGNIDDLPETGGQRTTYLKAGVRDGLGNLGYVPLTTSTGNPFTANGQLSTNLGVDPAVIGVSRTGGNFSVTGPPNGHVTKSPGSASWSSLLTGSLSGYAISGATWIRAYKDDDPTKVVYGAAPPSQAGWWMGASGSTVSSSSLTYNALVAQSISRLGGTGEGRYTIAFGGVDRAGNTPTGSPWAPFSTIYDATPPAVTITGTGPFTSGSMATVRVMVTDNVGIAGYALGPVFNLPNSGFAGGFAYTVPGQIRVGTLANPLMKSYGFDVTDVVPNGMVFYNPLSGAINTHLNNTIGVAGYARDWAYNYSPVAFKTFPNPANIAVPSDPSAVRFSVGSSVGCNGIGCAGGASNIMNVTASWDSPSATDPFAKYELYALSGDGRVNFLRTAPAATRATVSASLFRYTTTFTYDWSQYCAPTGSLLLFGLGQSLNRLFWYKPDSFSSFSLTAPAGGNPYCALVHEFPF